MAAQNEVELIVRAKNLSTRTINQLNDEAGFREFVGNVVAALRSAKGVVPQTLNRNLADSASLSGGSESARPSLS